MSDLVLRTASKATVARFRAASTLARMADRLRREDGQDMIEYAGVLVVVSIIIGIAVALFTGSLGNTIKTDITNTVTKILG